MDNHPNMDREQASSLLDFFLPDRELLFSLIGH
jgi:hypothetical protein